MNTLLPRPIRMFGGPLAALALGWANMPLAAQLNEEERAELRAVRAVRIEVKQTYGFANDEEPEPSAPKATPGARGFLPLLPLATEIVKFAGWRVAPGGAPADLTVRIELEGRALGADYTGTISGYQYTGAAISGTVTLNRSGRSLLEHAFEGEVSPPYSITSYYGTPASAPFSRTLPDYCAGLWTAIGQALGPGPLVAGIQRGSDDVKEGARQALLGVCDESTRPTFLSMLGGSDDEGLVRLAALGLGVVGESADFAPLLDALRAVTDVPGADLADRRGWVEIEYFPEGPEGRRAMAQEFMRGGSPDRRRALLWALTQIEAPDRTQRLVAAIRSGERGAFRASAALLLGGSEEPAAIELLASSLGDADALVRLAALAGLADQTGENLVEPLLRLTNDVDAAVRTLARERLEVFIDRRWSAFRTARKLPAVEAAAENAEFMAAAFAHSDPLVRAHALVLAGELSERPYRAAVGRMARQDSWVFLREQAIQVLKDDSDPAALEVLAAALQDPALPVREAALAALAGDSLEWERSSPPSLPGSVVAPALELARAEDGRQGDRAVGLLGRVGGLAATQALERLAREPGPEEVRRLAVLTLVRTRPSSSAPFLVELAGTATGGARDEAVSSGLAELSHPATLDPLFVVLKSGSPAGRKVAARALGGMKQPRAVGPLIAALQGAETPGAGYDETLASVIQTSLQDLTGEWRQSAADWRKWWKENSGRATAR